MRSSGSGRARPALFVALLAATGCADRPTASGADAAQPDAPIDVVESPDAPATPDVVAVDDTLAPDSSTAPDAAPPPDAGPSRGCALPAYPTPDCTGVPPGTTFTRTVSGDYTVSTDGTVIDAWHVTGDLVVTGNNVTVRNTQIDGTLSKGDTAGYHLTVEDTTIGPATGCIVGPGIDTANDTGNYLALRVHVRNHDDGFRAGGPDITIRDSFAKMCGVGPALAPPDGSHSDGVQDYPAAQRLVVDHNTFDNCRDWTTDRSRPPCTSSTYEGINSSIMVASNPTRGGGSTDVTVTNNLAMGGAYAIWFYPANGAWVVTGNRVVDATAAYGPYEAEGQCAHVATWSDNTTVTMDTAYHVTSTVSTVACPM